MSTSSGEAQTGVVLFVCTGNTCRSPLAAALWSVIAPDRPAASAGVGAWPGSPATEPARQVAREYGVSLDAHQARHVRDVAEPVARVYVMTRQQLERLIELRPEWSDRVQLLTEAAGETGDIPDPLGASIEVYRGLAERLVGLLKRVVEHGQSETGGTAP